MSSIEKYKIITDLQIQATASVLTAQWWMQDSQGIYSGCLVEAIIE